MKLFRRWLKEKPHEKKTDHQSRQPSIEPASSSARATRDQYDEDSSFNWLGDDDTVPVRTLTLCESPASTEKDDTGIDPYNSSRFEATRR